MLAAVLARSLRLLTCGCCFRSCCMLGPCCAYAVPMLCLCYGYAVPMLCLMQYLCSAYAVPMLCLCCLFLSCHEEFSGRSCGFSASEAALRARLQDSVLQRLAAVTVSASVRQNSGWRGCPVARSPYVVYSHFLGLPFHRNTTPRPWWSKPCI